MIIVSCLYLGLDLEGHHLKCGGVAEWFKAAVLKTAVLVRVPWVRILPPPPELS